MFENKKSLALLLLGLFATFAGIILLTTDGTVDEGDSISHFLYNKYAWKYPYFFLHHWAKPMFVILSFPFAQLGFIGIKFFNLSMGFIAAWSVNKIAESLEIKNAFIGIAVLLSMPSYFLTCFSGLTEPLFSAMVVVSYAFLLRDRVGLACLIIGFTPFARPEGLFFIGLFVLYIIFKKLKVKYVFYLIIGHLFFTLLGVLLLDEAWHWVFTKNPNAEITPTYGRTGSYLHYIKGLMYALGLPIYILSFGGSLFLFYQALRKWGSKSWEKLLLLAGIASVIFMHTIFWKFGLFKSFGLMRNMLTIAPLLAVAAIVGFNGLVTLVPEFKSAKKFVFALLFALICIYPYLGVKYSFKFPESFNKNNIQIMGEKAADFVNENYPNSIVYHYQPHISMYRDVDYFDWTRRQELNLEKHNLRYAPNAVIIWDDWLARIEGKVTLEMLEQDSILTELTRFSSIDHTGKERMMVLFHRK